MFPEISGKNNGNIELTMGNRRKMYPARWKAEDFRQKIKDKRSKNLEQIHLKSLQINKLTDSQNIEQHLPLASL